MFFENAGWRWREFMQKAIHGKSYTEMSYYNPKTEYSRLTKTYYTYVQPVILLFLVVWLVALIRALRAEDYIKKFGFMTLYSTIELLALIIQTGFFAYIFTRDYNYLQYEVCYAFESFNQCALPLMFMVSQWLKIAQAFQRFIIFYKPIGYKRIFNRWSVTIFFIVVLIVSFSFATRWFLLIDLERVVIIEQATMEIVEICRVPGFFSSEAIPSQDDHEQTMSMLYELFQTLVPLILMSVISIASIYIIRKQANFRNQFNVGRTVREIAYERLVKVTIATTIFFAINRLSNAIKLVVMYTRYEQTLYHTIYYIGYISNALIVLSIPFNFLFFSLLSAAFRKALQKVWKRLRRQNTDE